MKLKQPNNRTTEQFRFCLLAFIVLVLPFITISQNINDPYLDVVGLSTSTYQATGTQYINNYQGEYQLYLPSDHPWSDIPNAEFMVKTECVSFPFLPIYKYHSYQNRTLGIPNSNSFLHNDQQGYFISQDYYNPSKTNATLQTFINSPNFDNKQNLLYTKFLGEAWYSVGWNNSNYNGFLSTIPTNTDNNTLISELFIRTNSNYSTQSNSGRNLFPHSILKHTLYVRSSCNPTEIIDSIVYIVDLTRGSMVNYPFTNTAINPTGAGETHYDVVVKFEGKAEINYGQTGSNFTSEHTTNTYPIYNYFTLENTNWLYESGTSCNSTKYIPDTYPSSGSFLQSSGKPHIKLPQYSKTGVLLLNQTLSNRAGYDNSSSTLSNINPLHKHSYRIDRYFDITLINPSEKIVYNPSEVEIDLNNTNNTGSHTLTFPSGYTFKTVLGNYPEKSVVAAADPNNYYSKNPFNIPVANDANTGNYSSKYIIKDGSKLVIKDCVTLMDVEFVVEPGGKLSYNSQALYGANFTLPPDNSSTLGTIEDRNTAASSVCTQFCLDTSPTVADWHNYTVFIDEIISANAPPIRVFGTLTIAAGKKLILEEGSVLEFAPNSRVIVEDGAQFIANGVSGNEVQLTSMCTNMWDGIELRGNTTKATCKLKYTLVKNALVGIRDFSTRQKDDTKGFVDVVNVTFRNCITGIHLKNNNIAEQANIAACTFETTDEIPDKRFSLNNPNKPTIIHVFADKCHYNYFMLYCTFQNLYLDLKPHERGIGIKAIDSYVNLGFYNNTNINTFSNLSVGIFLNDVKTRTFSRIANAVFNNNIYGIISLDRNYVSIHHNTFVVPENASGTNSNTNNISEANSNLYNRPTGIYVKNSSGFGLNNNSFNGVPASNTGANCEFCNQAIVIDGTTYNGQYPGNGLIMNNTFNKVNIGVLAQNGNGNGSGVDENLYVSGSGVSAVCNTFNDLLSYDMAFPKAPIWMSQTPIRDQGYCANLTGNSQYDHPALNTFNTCSGQTRNVHNYYQNQDFKYYHAINNTPGCYATVTMKPCDNFNTDDDDVSAKCYDYYSNFDPSSVPLVTKRQQYTDKVKELEERTSSFDNLLDGGNTANLLDVVKNGTLATAIAQLEAAGAYISDAVLEAAITRLGVEETQKLILILQTNSKLSSAVWDAVVTHTITYNSGLVEALTTYQEGVSARDSYIKWIDYTAYERNTIFDGLYFADMLVDSTLTVTLDVLRNDDDPYIQKKLLPLLISEGEFTEAETLLATIKETDNSSLYILEQEAKLLMYRDAIGFYKLPESLKDALAQYWIDAPQQSSWSAMQAGIHTWEYYINPELINASTENNKWDGVQEDKQKENLNTSSYLTCYPNPTTSGGVLKGFVPMVKDAHNQIKIYNSIGQLVLTKRIKTEQFEIEIQLPAKGLYFVALYQNHTLIKYQKWVVQ